MSRTRRAVAYAAAALTVLMVSMVGAVITAAPASADSYTWQGIRRCKVPYRYVYADDDLRLHYTATRRKADAVDIQTGSKIYSVTVEEFRGGGVRVGVWSKVIKSYGGRVYPSLPWMKRSNYARFRVTLYVKKARIAGYDKCYNEWYYNGNTAPVVHALGDPAAPVALRREGAGLAA
jgi:hypothetical protein